MTRDEGFLFQTFANDPAAYEAARKRLAAGEPLAYILGEWDFYDLTLHLNTDCLIPRPDTEHLAEHLIRTLPRGGRFADYCTGSGCIALAVLHHRPDTSAVAVDLSEGALRVAAENAERLGLSQRISFQKADLLREVPFANEEFACIVCNPPYIPSAVVDTLDASVRCYEPRAALDGGADGLDFYRVLLSRHSGALQKDGCFVFEIGYDQADALRRLAPGCTVKKDYAANDRVVIVPKASLGSRSPSN